MDIPWVSRDKVHIELLYKVTNTSGDDGKFNVLVDGATEYTKYDYKIVSDAIANGATPTRKRCLFPLHADDEVADSRGGARGTAAFLREDDFEEGARNISWPLAAAD